MRWREGVEGHGPDACRACKKARREETRCGKCGEPEVLPELVPILTLLSRCHSQWERSPSTGARLGLPVERVEAMERRLGLSLTQAEFLLLQQAEMEIINIDLDRTRQAIANRTKR